jgi:Uma2 family endonuclease
MDINPDKQYFTVQEYIDLQMKNKPRMEYDHGEIFVLAGSTSYHALLAQNMFYALKTALGENPPVKPYIFGMMVNVVDEIIFMPDLVACNEEKDNKEDPSIVAYPRLVCEVVTRLTQQRDMQYKLGIYQENEYIEEVIFVSQYMQQIEVVSRTFDGWETKKYEPGEDVVLPNFQISISMDDIYEDLKIPKVSQVREERAEYSVETEGYYLRDYQGGPVLLPLPGNSGSILVQ